LSRPRRSPVFIAAIGALALALPLTACGRKGPLDPPPGGQMLDGGVVSVQLRRSHADDGTALAQLAVSDTGVGVPDGEHERVFERFFRGSNIRGTYAGLGVGLYVARAIVDLHGGRIWLESEPRLGTICHVALPLAA